MILFSIFFILLILIVGVFLYVKVSNYLFYKEKNKPRNKVLKELIKDESNPVIRSRYVVEEKGYLRILQELIFVIHHDRLNKVGNHLHEPIKEFAINDFHLFTNISIPIQQSIKLSFSRDSFPELEIDSFTYDKDSFEFSNQYFNINIFRYSDEFDKKINQLLNLVHPIWLEIRKEQYKKIQDEKSKQEELELQKKKELDKRYSGF
jgi:hypothetical protein